MNIVLIGRTGDGKSAAANYIASLISGDKDTRFFDDSANISSHTFDPKCATVGSDPVFRVIDTPGLMDSSGDSHDSDNIVNIVRYLKTEFAGGIHCFVLVINEKTPRFDGPMRDAYKLFVDAFGVRFYNYAYMLFTRSDFKAEKALTTATQYKAALPDYQKQNPLPFAQIDSKPYETFRKVADLINEDEEWIAKAIKKVDGKNQEAVRSLLLFARTQVDGPLRTSDFNEQAQTALALAALAASKEANAELRAHYDSQLALMQSQMAEKSAENLRMAEHYQRQYDEVKAMNESLSAQAAEARELVAKFQAEAEERKAEYDRQQEANMLAIEQLRAEFEEVNLRSLQKEEEARRAYEEGLTAIRANMLISEEQRAREIEALRLENEERERAYQLQREEEARKVDEANAELQAKIENDRREFERQKADEEGRMQELAATVKQAEEARQRLANLEAERKGVSD